MVHLVGKLVELRSFEMPPHWQMAQFSICWCARYCCSGKTQLRAPGALGTQLTDRWMLPRYLIFDMQRVCRDLQEHNIPVRPNGLRRIAISVCRWVN